MNQEDQQRSPESKIVGVGIKYGGKVVLHYMPCSKIIFALFVVRLGFRKRVSFKMKFTGVVST